MVYADGDAELQRLRKLTTDALRATGCQCALYEMPGSVNGRRAYLTAEHDDDCPALEGMEDGEGVDEDVLPPLKHMTRGEQ